MKHPSRTFKVIVALIFPLILLIAWEAVVRAKLIPPSQSAAPSAVIARLFVLFFDGVLVSHAFYSLLRLLAGVSLGAILGISTSVLIINSRIADRLFSPTVQLLAGVPVVLWIPFCVMFFGTEEAFRISLIAISTFFLIHSSTYLAMLATGKKYIELAEVYEKSVGERIWHIFLPAAAPAIFTAMRIAFALGWIVIFFVEYASSERGKEGLGWFIADTRQVGRIEDQFAGLLLLALIAFSIDKFLGFIQRRFLDWSDTVESTNYLGVAQ